MKKIFLLIPVMMLALSGCNTNQSQSNKEVYDVKWVTPVGAPTLAFYDQGENENWLSTDSPADVIPGAFVASNYDAIVFDGLTGLNLIKKNSSNTLSSFSNNKNKEFNKNIYMYGADNYCNGVLLFIKTLFMSLLFIFFHIYYLFF